MVMTFTQSAVHWSHFLKDHEVGLKQATLFSDLKVNELSLHVILALKRHI